MGIYNWVSLAMREAGASKDAGQVFNGVCNISIGTSLYGVFGNRDTHIFGDDVHLCSTGAAAGIGGLIGKYFNYAGMMPLIDGNADFCYGARTQMTYGGPFLGVVRGPFIRKVAYKPLSWREPWATFTDDLAVNLPREPTGVEAAADDQKTLRAISALSLLLNLTVASLELAIRIAYPHFDPRAKENPQTATILNAVVSSVSDLMTGLIRQIEMAGGWTQKGKLLKAEALDKYNKYLVPVGRVLSLPLTGAKKVAAAYTRASEDTKEAIKLTIACLFLIGILVAIAVVMEKSSRSP